MFSPSPLHYAVTAGHQSFVSLLLSYGACVGRDTWKGTPLGYALEQGQDEIARMLLDAGATVTEKRDREALDGTNSQRCRSASGLHSVSRILDLDPLGNIEAKACFFALRIFESVAPLVQSRYTQHPNSSPTTELITILLQGLDTGSIGELSLKKPIQDLPDHHFLHVFWLLSIVQPEPLAELLTTVPSIRARADRLMPNHVDSADTQLLVCLSRAGYLLPVPDTSWVDARPWTPLHEACESGSAKRVEHVLRQDDGSVDVNAKGLRDRTPLHIAAQSGRIETVKLLIEHGASLNAKTSFGSTAEDLAAKRGCRQVKGLLCKNTRI
ncbi:ankyrin repeat-containing domain protein [Apodospora peruviana]|uniref:Ankyrin repeat-containing domain protein n=1 Tax=Apodospora peruviana TaxID=516989 RepID=A0AAE0I196_9PEZI|nr:ankyrin repeat-containing domain protein [Apodospora peruviana]